MTKFDELKIGDIFTFPSRNKTYFYIYYKEEFIVNLFK